VEILFGHSMLLRGKSMRGGELPDLFTVEMKDEGPTPCWPILLIMNSGKTNQFNKLDYGVVARLRTMKCFKPERFSHKIETSLQV
jgi:hypothetical protein